MKRKIQAILFGVFLSLILIEIIAQISYQFIVKKAFEEQEEKYLFYKKSRDEVLGYELKTNWQTTSVNSPDRLLIINHLGVRDANLVQDTLEYVALCGDSVTFGMTSTQDSTLSELLNQQVKGSCLKFINLGVPGYDTYQINRRLQIQQENYKFKTAIYLLNWNDFQLHTSLSGGADGNLYTYFKPPTFKTYWFLKTLVFRLRTSTDLKNMGALCDFFYQNNEESIFAEISSMNVWAKSKNITFKVFVLPNITSKTLLQKQQQEVLDFLNTNKISYLAPIDELVSTEKLLFTSKFNDHLNSEGNKVVAKIIYDKWFNKITNNKIAPIIQTAK